ncbi:MAG TPA: SDR family oxidoreductase [bacterium]|nr:SDR family oxidoreductase [bacterium]
MALIGILKGKGPSGFGYNSTAEQVTAGLDLSGQTFLLTGCTSGIGQETLRVLGLRGAHMVAAARSQEAAQQALAVTGAAGTAVACDLSEPASVRACVAGVQGLGRPLDGIVCNAGIMALPKLQQKHGYELQFLTNHIGHFLLVTGLLEQLALQGRVVCVSSSAHWAAPPEGIQFDNLDGRRGYGAWRAYGQSKLANILFARALARRLGSGGRTANALHPGVIHTRLQRHMNPVLVAAFALAGPLVLKTAAQGAATQCYVATQPKLAGVTGAFFADCNEARTSGLGREDTLAERLWQVSEEIAARLS